MENIINKKFNRLLIVRKVYEDKQLYECLCDCGKTVYAYKNSIISGNVKSCGCYRLDKIRNLQLKHDKAHTRLYNVWKDMKKRCYNPNSHSYKNYGAKGIKVCDEWKDNFIAFHDWSFANGYDENAEFGKCTIDRINVGGDYSPENCHWVSLKEQANNRTNSSQITFNGKTDTMSNWAREVGIPYTCLFHRLHDLHWSVEKALTTPQRITKKKST